MKKCVDCLMEKRVEEFSKGKTGLHGRRSYCRACAKVRDKERMSQPHAKKLAVEATKRYRHKNKEKIKDKNRLKKLNKMLESIPSLCPHCLAKVDQLLPAT